MEREGSYSQTRVVFIYLIKRKMEKMRVRDSTSFFPPSIQRRPTSVWLRLSPPKSCHHHHHELLLLHWAWFLSCKTRCVMFRWRVVRDRASCTNYPDSLLRSASNVYLRKEDGKKINASHYKLILKRQVGERFFLLRCRCSLKIVRLRVDVLKGMLLRYTSLSPPLFSFLSFCASS